MMLLYPILQQILENYLFISPTCTSLAQSTKGWLLFLNLFCQQKSLGFVTWYVFLNAYNFFFHNFRVDT